MCSDEKSLEKIAYVLASEHRKNIILFMEDRLATPKEIGDAINVRTNNMTWFIIQHHQSAKVAFTA